MISVCIATYNSEKYIKEQLCSIIIQLGYKQNYLNAIVPWGMIVFCIAMLSFTNYFNMFFTWLVIILNLFLILQRKKE